MTGTVLTGPADDHNQMVSSNLVRRFEASLSIVRHFQSLESIFEAKSQLKAASETSKALWKSKCLDLV